MLQRSLLRLPLLLLFIIPLVALSCEALPEKEYKQQPAREDYFELELDHRIWQADSWNAHGHLQDDGRHVSIVIEAERSSMDMDPENKGWLIRFYLQAPKSKIDQLKGRYSIAPGKDAARVYFRHGEEETLEVSGELTIDASEAVQEDQSATFTLLQGSFQLKTEAGQLIEGNFSIN